MERKYIISVVATIVIALGGYFIYQGIDRPVAIVNGEAITSAQLERALSSRSTIHEGTGAKVGSDSLRSSVLEQLISDVLLLQGAVEAGVTVPEEEVSAAIAEAKKRFGEDRYNEYLKANSMTDEEYFTSLWQKMMRERFVDQYVFSEQVPEDEIKEYYKDSPIPFMTGEMVDVRIIEMETMEEAEAVAKEMRAIGKDGFDKVADRLKDDESLFVSEYGETNPFFYPGVVGQAMRELQEGELGGPYQGKEGVFLVRIRKRTAERPKTFEEARGEIEAILKERRRNASVMHWIANKRNSSNIVRK